MKIVRRVAGAVGIAATAVLLGATPALAAGGTVHTDSGAPLTVRSSPSTSAGSVGTIADGTAVTIDCQTSGDTVTGKYGTSDVWDHVPASGGYISDAYVYTGSDGRVAPDCGGSSTTACSTSGTGDPNTCAEAVAKAKSRVHTTYDSSYDGWCDRINAQNYGWSASGSTTAYVHWTQIPASYKHANDTNVPAGGLAFFSNGGAGHTMISIGGGQFLSNDIHGAGTYTQTTIAEIKQTWGQTYLGWAQPWFKVNH
ncbi:uncharacterized protein YraI [Amycolatopsis bartoniae]|uniref:SH3b domain-containing protein n=1 Tax=Amycolatopsis bartoniae TaxID=941986 RepID=A0A8H9ISA0_9PSEU|nr:hypothetical protein [Amycolatopsis bartoniae]MBB2937105.1 uncharacterized protein YraI [Amycolatopsis bartoniae]TVT04762.1 hypothetical protein FNH07_23840 [Amycolatopsis bartoniae]GHF52468.1 hypothetical protein GCM10017566_27280 [Amycolatopsis bartoniae]